MLAARVCTSKRRFASWSAMKAFGHRVRRASRPVLEALRAFRLHPVFLAGAAADEASARDVCGHCGGQEPPFSRNLRMPFPSSDAGRCCRRRGLSACRGHPLLLAGAAVGEASVHAARRHCCRQVLPSARNKRMPLASIAVGRSCRRRGLSTCRLHALLQGGAAAFGVSMRDACV